MISSYQRSPFKSSLSFGGLRVQIHYQLTLVSTDSNSKSGTIIRTRPLSSKSSNSSRSSNSNISSSRCSSSNPKKSKSSGDQSKLLIVQLQHLHLPSVKYHSH
ncbi:hypothetical protein ACTFIV_010351 [Dictyostelium citrinum]